MRQKKLNSKHTKATLGAKFTNPRLDKSDGFPLHLNRLKIAVGYACSIIGMNYSKAKGKKQ